MLSDLPSLDSGRAAAGVQPGLFYAAGVGVWFCCKPGAARPINRENSLTSAVSTANGLGGTSASNLLNG